MIGVLLYLACISLLVTQSLGVGSELETVVVDSLHTASYISYRFATTYVTSTLTNKASRAREIGYEVQLPQEAFIANFSMLIEGKVYPGSVKEKEKAKKDYEEAKKRGESAGHVAVKSRTANMFRVSVNVAANQLVTFNLTYQELLKRRLGYYEHVIYIDPGQTVPDMLVEVFMLESRPITSVMVPPIRNDILTSTKVEVMNKLATIERPTKNSAYIKFQPSEQEQRSKQSQGVQGQFVVRYDVERDAGVGEVLVVNGYFVHFLAPKDLKPLPRDVMFVIDTSGSMTGKKINQVKQALKTFLVDLKKQDRFNLAFFSSDMKFWKNKFLHVIPSALENALDTIIKIAASGGTNMYDGIVDSIDFFMQNGDRKRAGLLLFLTDGQPTSGVTDRERIIEDSTNINEGVIAMFGLAFGAGADYNLVKAVSVRNNGVARKIYEDSDATLQLKGFYNEISSPLLSNITVRYVGDGVDQPSITQTLFHNYYDGAELVIAGQVTNGVVTMDLYINAEKSDGIFLQHDKVTPSLTLTKEQLGFGIDIKQFSRNLWAYLTIKQLLKKMDMTDDTAELARIKKQALDLSLKHGFVTPLTSMVVTKPNANQIAHDDVSDSLPGRSPVSQRSSVSRSRSKSKSSPGSGPPGGSVDSDPHFMLPVEGTTHPVCFDIAGSPGVVLQLLSDHKQGLYANAQMFDVNVTKPNKVGQQHRELRHYMNAVTVLVRHIKVSVTVAGVMVSDRGGIVSLNWKRSQEYTVGRVDVLLHHQHSVTIMIGGDIVLKILKHRHRAMALTFLGLYVEKGAGFSKNVGGLIGEFQHKRVQETLVDSQDKDVAVLRITDARGHDHLTAVRLVKHMNLALHSRIACWHVNKESRSAILNYAPHSYLVPHLNCRSRRKRTSGSGLQCE